ncbi:52 kDa repressor of the inhibitor of the protein kinase-like [Ixodes scapularis]|uniref:52 kDa repressor of the inhibitor of the protein kinase-like n=1 Tax=Ixodes scapularis TaxID=6945 RepID=UPI001A9E3A26|nr:52 kDa repressor of the inhibitor of the protein kinase-like [Ixodes scapularis]
MGEVIAVFTAKPKRNAVLKLPFDKQPTKLSYTHWFESHDAVSQFRESVGSIAKALETVSQWREQSSAAKVRSLLTTILDAEFVSATLAPYDVLSVMLPLSRLLQKPDLEMNSASDIVKGRIVVVSETRYPLNVDKTFRKLFVHAEDIAENMGAQINVPRLVQRQMNWANLCPQTAESYFHAHVYIPLVESVVEDLKQRLPEKLLEEYSLNALLPRLGSDKGARAKLSILAAKYGVLLGMGDAALQTIVRTECSLWAAKWSRDRKKGPLPSTAVKTPQESELELYPNIRNLLRVLATLAVSVATAEQSSSTLRRIKTWIRSRCGEMRLNGLAILHVRRDVNFNQQKVIDRYAQGARRRKAMFVL